MPDEKVQANFYLLPETQRRLKIHAAKTGESMSALVERAIERLLLEEEEEK